MADLPRDLAAAALDGLIRRVPAGGWDQSQTRTIATRLIELLPRHGRVVRPGEAQSGSSKTAPARSSAVICLLVVALGVAVLFSVW